MKNIFKLLILAGILVFSGYLFPNKVQAQVTFNDNIDENRLVYWFFVSVREKEDGETGYVSYDLQLKGNKIQHGSQKDYDKNFGNI